MLDLVFASNPSLVKSSISIPGISYHDAILTDIDLKPKLNTKKRRKILKYGRANWDQIAIDCDAIFPIIQTMVSENQDTNIADLWSIFKDRLIKSIELNIPSKLSKSTPSLHWITYKLKRLLRRKERIYKQAL